MDESKLLLSWLLKHTLENHFEGNKTKMANDMKIHRHTLWRAFRIIDGEKGEISPLVAQQLLWCCMRNDYSLDQPIRNYLNHRALESDKQCQYVQGWLKQVGEAGKRQSDADAVTQIVMQVIPEWQGILGCAQKGDHLTPDSLQYCKYEPNCPILKLMEIARADTDSCSSSGSFAEMEVNLPLDS